MSEHQRSSSHRNPRNQWGSLRSMQRCNYAEWPKCPFTDPETNSFWLKQMYGWVWLSFCTQLAFFNTHTHTHTNIHRGVNTYNNTTSLIYWCKCTRPNRHTPAHTSMLSESISNWMDWSACQSTSELWNRGRSPWDKLVFNEREYWSVWNLI